MRLTVARLTLVLSLLAAAPAPALAQPFDPPTDYIYGMSSIDYAIWMFDRNDPYNTRQRVDFNLYGVSIAVDIMTDRVYVRLQAETAVWCADATTLAYFPEPGGNEPTCGFFTAEGNGAIAIDPVRRVLYSDGAAGAALETNDCADTLPNIQQDAQVQAYSLDARNRGTLIASIEDPGASHSATDGNHLTLVPEEGVLWSAASEWTDNVRPRRIETGNINMNSGDFGALEITGLPTIMPASSIGVDPDGRRIFLIPWNPPTHASPNENTIADHPEAQHVHVYDMDTYAETGVLDYRTIPGDWDDNTHCGYNTDFKIYYDRVGNWLIETNFYEFRATFYDLTAGQAYEPPFGGDNCSGHEGTGDCIFDLYGFDGPLDISHYELDSDGDGLTTMVELGATEITIDAAYNDQDPRQHTDPDVADSDGDGLNDGAEDADHNGRVDAGETNPADPTDNPDDDYDGDGTINRDDNCRAVANPDQADEDHDGRGDVCDGNDGDLDGIPDDLDNCDCLPNPDQLPDACTATDQDGDGAEDTVDNCACVANPDQGDGNGDGIGDACSADADEDGIVDAVDNCRDVANPDQADNCSDDGGQGDACSPNQDQDQYADACDNCPDVGNDGQDDNCDADDGLGDACSPDEDNDNVQDACDNCPDVANTDQTDLDGDGVGAACSDKPDDCACSAAGAANVLDVPATLVSIALAGLVAIRRRRRR